MRYIFSLRLVIILIPVLLLVLLVLPVQIRILYEGRGHSHRGQLRLGIFRGRLGLKIGFPPPRQRPQRGMALTRNKVALRYRFRPGRNGAILNQWRHWRDLLAGIRRIVGVGKELLHRSVCTRLLWETGFGLDDYAATGMSTGLLWAGKSMLLSLLSRHVRINPAGVRIAVVPQFGSNCYASTLDCILETSLGHIIVVAFKLGAIWLIRSPGLLARRKRYA